MSLATDKLETIREQVQYHLDHAEKKKLTPQQERALKDQIKERLEQENAVIVAHYYTSPAVQSLAEETWSTKNPRLCHPIWGRIPPQILRLLQPLRHNI